MSVRTSIEWTRGDDGTPGATWNPVTGCTKLSPASPGCENCYASTFAERFRGVKGHYFEGGFDVQMRPGKLDLPLRWRRGRRIFVNSMSDLFHDQVPDDYIAAVFAVMACNYLWDRPTHTFQVLTKRHARMRALLSSSDFRAAVAVHAAERTDEEHADRMHDAVLLRCWPLPNVWLGVSAEDQHWADIRIPVLEATPASVRVVSLEPLLSAVDLTPCRCQGGYSLGCARHNVGSLTDVQLNSRSVFFPNVDWVITGGESGARAHPMDPQWARSIRDQCRAVGVAYLHKQNGEWVSTGRYGSGVLDRQHAYGSATQEVPGGLVMREVLHRVGKKVAGRELDGQVYDEFPASSCVPRSGDAGGRRGAVSGVSAEVGRR